MKRRTRKLMAECERVSANALFEELETEIQRPDADEETILFLIDEVQSRISRLRSQVEKVFAVAPGLRAGRGLEPEPTYAMPAKGHPW